MKKIISLIIVLYFTVTIQAQKQAYNWTFGYKAGLSWNETRSFSVTGLTPAATETNLNGLPTSFTSTINTDEGCFTVSNDMGKLLFYSDGITVYNQNGIIMPNGKNLLGHSSSSQSGITFPYPENSSRYVAVTLNDYNKPNNIGYSVIDMSLNNGLGDVVFPNPGTASDPSNLKNIKLTGSSGDVDESVSSVLHSNGKDYWIIAPGRGTTSYLNAWLFTKDGITTPPVVTPINFSTLTNISLGYIKFTADGKHFIWCNTSDKAVYIGNFDTTTGISSNVKKLSISGTRSAYGVEFSPDQKLVYLSASFLYVYKADELFTLTNLLYAAKKSYSLMSATSSAALQLGIDKRIYYNEPSSRNMYVIDNPNDFDNPKIYKLTNFLEAGSTAKAGLPNFPASYFEIIPISNKFSCTGHSYKFNITAERAGTNVPVKLMWNFGDNTTTEQNLNIGQTNYEMSHIYNIAGDYNVIITPVNAEEISLEPIKITAKVIDCSIKTNRMIRVDLQNLDTLPPPPKK